jgi:hypothetical protein
MTQLDQMLVVVSIIWWHVVVLLSTHFAAAFPSARLDGRNNLWSPELQKKTLI